MGRSCAIRIALSWLLLSLALTSATVITGIQLKPSYDFVIVGGGTAGNVLANRLSENPDYQVLVIEAGPSEVDVEVPVAVPFLWNTVTPSTPWDWNYTTTPQEGLGGRVLPYPRGRILGGTSSANAMLFTRGAIDNWNQFAALTGDIGWAWKNIFKYHKKVERWTLPADGHNITGEFDPTVHGHSGLLNISLQGFPNGIDKKVAAASAQLGGRFKFNLDMNSGHVLGISWLQYTINKAFRSSSATSYLDPGSFRQRPNLSILLGAQVSRVLNTGSTAGGVPIFRRVEFVTSLGAPRINVTATKEVILSAGSIGSPHILLNSGIGDSRALSKIGIKPLVDLPDVGENLSDHAFTINPWNVNSTDTFDNVIQNKTVAAEALNKWRTTGQGVMVDSVSSQIGFYRVPRNNSVWLTNPDPSPGSSSPHYEHLFLNFFPVPTGHYMAIGTIVVAPTSRGSVKLASSDPFAAPIIDPAILKTEADKVIMREAVKSAQVLVTAPAFEGYILDQALNFTNVKTDAEIDAYLTQNTATIWHPAGTAAMSPPGARSGVTNPDLTVKKVAGLRIVDASIFPFVPAAHPQAALYAVAERVSDIIKAKYSYGSN